MFFWGATFVVVLVVDGLEGRGCKPTKVSGIFVLAIGWGALAGMSGLFIFISIG